MGRERSLPTPEPSKLVSVYPLCGADTIVVLVKCGEPRNAPVRVLN